MLIWLFIQVIITHSLWLKLTHADSSENQGIHLLQAKIFVNIGYYSRRMQHVRDSCRVGIEKWSTDNFLIHICSAFSLWANKRHQNLSATGSKFQWPMVQSGNKAGSAVGTDVNPAQTSVPPSDRFPEIYSDLKSVPMHTIEMCISEIFYPQRLIVFTNLDSLRS